MTGFEPRVDRHNWERFAAPRIERRRWAGIIAAAGRGSRLGYDKPKVLFPVAGRPILAWLLDLLLPHCEAIVAVLSPEGRAQVEERLEQWAPGRYRIAIQSDPRGMGDAVETGLAKVSEPNTVVLWGDQAAVRPASIEAVMRLHDGKLAPDLTIPTVGRAAPYIHFERDAAGGIAAVLQKREGDAMPEQGESDTGLFCFRTEALRELLSLIRDSGGARGARTDEFNLLPVIPLAARSGYSVLTPALMTQEETVGINGPEDVEDVERFLRSRHG